MPRRCWTSRACVMGLIRPDCAAQVLDEPGLLTPTHSTRLTLGGSGAKAQSSCCG
jgi:hypothetical protein